MKSDKKQSLQTRIENRDRQRRTVGVIKTVVVILLLIVVFGFGGLFIYCQGIGASFTGAVVAFFTGDFQEFENIINPEKYLESPVVEGFVQNEYPDDSDRFITIGDTLFKVSNNSIVKYTSTGVISQEVRIDMRESRIHRAGKYMLVFDIGGQLAYLVTEQTISAISLSDPVLTATVSYGGYTAFVLEADNYMSAVSVFDQAGQLISTRYIQNDVVVWAGVSPDNSYYCINRVSLGDLQASSYLEYNKIGEVTSYAMESYPETLIANCAFAQNGTMVAVADNKIIHIGTGRKPVSQLEVSAIHAVSQSPEGDIFVSAEVKDGAHGQNRIYIFGKDGDSSFFNTDLAVTSISAQAGHICAVIGTGAMICDYSGQIITTFASQGQGANDIILYRDSYLVIYRHTVDKRRY